MIKAEGKIKTPNYGKSNCLLEITTEGEEIVIKTAEVKLFIPVEAMRKATEKKTSE